MHMCVNRDVYVSVCICVQCVAGMTHPVRRHLWDSVSHAPASPLVVEGHVDWSPLSTLPLCVAEFTLTTECRR